MCAATSGPSSDQEVEFPLIHVATLQVEAGWAVCVSGKLIVVTEINYDRVSVYDADSLGRVAQFGGTGRDLGQFLFDGYHGGLCTNFVATTVFVSDHGNKRVSEHALPDGRCVRVLGLTHLHSPLGVDANATHVAVTDYWYDNGRQTRQSQVLVFDVHVAADTPPLWVFGGESGASLRHLNCAVAVKFTRDGTGVHVVDCTNGRLVRIPITGSESCATVEAHGLTMPYDVLECSDGGLVIADFDEDWLVKVGTRGGCGTFGTGAVTRFGLRGLSDGRFRYPGGLAFLSNKCGNGLVVRDFDRVQIFETVWTRLRFAWIEVVTIENEI